MLLLRIDISRHKDLQQRFVPCLAAKIVCRTDQLRHKSYFVMRWMNLFTQLLRFTVKKPRDIYRDWFAVNDSVTLGIKFEQNV